MQLTDQKYDSIIQGGDLNVTLLSNMSASDLWTLFGHQINQLVEK